VYKVLKYLTKMTEPRSRGLLIDLMMEAASTSETPANLYQTTRRYNPEDSHLQVVTYRFFYGEELLDHHSTPKLKDHPLSAVLD
jgi:hypothetical protein